MLKLIPFLLLMPASDINEQIRQAHARNDYPMIASLHLQIIRENGFHYGNAKAVVDAYSRINEPAKALALARGWATPANYPGGEVVLADALIRNQLYADARKRLRGLSTLQPSNAQARGYLEDVRQRAAKKRYELTWQLRPDATRNLGPEWFAPPQNRPNQRLVNLTITGGRFTDQKTDSFGNEIRLVEAEKGETLTVRAIVELAPYSVRPELSKFSGEIPAEVQEFLKASPGIEPEAKEATEFSNTLKSLPMVKRVEAIMEHANKVLVYGVGSVHGFDSSTAAIARGGGHCTAISKSVVAWLRAAGVPARMIRGHSAINGTGGEMKQHTIPEYYLPGIGWRDWDHKYPVFSSRDNFVRHGSFVDDRFGWKHPFVFFQWREFVPAENPSEPWNGPYRYKLLSVSLED